MCSLRVIKQNMINNNYEDYAMFWTNSIIMTVIIVNYWHDCKYIFGLSSC